MGITNDQHIFNTRLLVALTVAVFFHRLYMISTMGTMDAIDLDDAIEAVD
jgi:hypothetical protein